jgi:hypothetical protein
MRKRLQVIAASEFLPIILERPGTGDVCGEVVNGRYGWVGFWAEMSRQRWRNPFPTKI